jgi:glycosyltransferase involved in cell wall biosynthesis
VLPELTAAAREIRADLYIAHNLGALPAAVAAAEENRAQVGFDAEDFHSGTGREDAYQTAIIAKVEKDFLTQCKYITAASPGIAQAYAAKYAITTPVTLLNVFPLADQPSVLRSSQADRPLTLYWFSQTIGATRGLEDVVRAMGHLKDLKIDLHLRGAWQNHYRSRLFDLASSVGVTPEHIVSHGPDSADEMTRLAARFDIGLALEPGHNINNDLCISNKIFTYLLAGCGVIATATSGQRSIVEQIGAAGFLYEPGDSESLAKGLRTWYDDRSALMAARREAWEWGTRKFNWDLEKKKFLTVVESTLATAQSGNVRSVAQ